MFLEDLDVKFYKIREVTVIIIETREGTGNLPRLAGSLAGWVFKLLY